MAAVRMMWRRLAVIVIGLPSFSQAFPEVKGIDKLGCVVVRVQLGLGVRLALATLLGMDSSAVAIGVAGKPDFNTYLA